MGPRLDGQSTIINFLIWVGFAHHFDAGADICADADVNILSQGADRTRAGRALWRGNIRKDDL